MYRSNAIYKIYEIYELCHANWKKKLSWEMLFKLYWCIYFSFDCLPIKIMYYEKVYILMYELCMLFNKSLLQN